MILFNSISCKLKTTQSHLMIRFPFLIFLVLFFSNYSFSQEKSIRKKNVTTTTLQYIAKNYEGAKRIRYYEERIEKGILIECEFHYQKEEISLVFYNDSLIETELTIDYQILPENLRNTINAQLNELFKVHKVIDVQSINPKNENKFELNVRVNDKQYFEIYFDDQGVILMKREIIVKPIVTQF